MQVQQTRWQVFPTASQLQDAATTAILKSAEEAIAARGRFSIVHRRWHHPQGNHQRLRAAQPIGPSGIYYGDERCRPSIRRDATA